jgi:alpha-1,6-mannosyltransferase
MSDLGGIPRLICDLTQSWSEVGGGVRTYLLHKRRHILQKTAHRHLLIVPGARDTVVEDERSITVTIASPRVPGSPNYRLMVRSRAARATLAQYRPDLIECQDAYNLPWTAIAYRRRSPGTALVAAYMTDFPTVYVERPFSKAFGSALARTAARVCYRYCGSLYRQFDSVFALSEHGGGAKLRKLGLAPDIIPLGVEVGEFTPRKRSEALRQSLGAQPHQPLLIYVGRLDREKKAQTVVEAFNRLPRELGAKLVLLGEGPLRESVASLDERIIAPGYVRDRVEVARWLASSDIYVSGMADETFGVSIIEAQASGLPVVGVAAGAMLDRVSADIGRLGPVDDSAAMAANIVDIWKGDISAMGDRACRHALQYSWEGSMEALFGRVYPKALAARAVAQRVVVRPSAAGQPVAP